MSMATIWMILNPSLTIYRSILMENESLRNVKTSISDTYEEYTLVANQEKLSQLGLTAAQVGMGLAGNGQRQVLTTIENDGKEMNVYLEVEKDEYENIKEITDKTIQSPLGMEVPIKDVVKIKEGNTSDTITRRDGRIYASVSAEITTKDVAKVSTAVQKKVDHLKIPSTVDISVGGVSKILLNPLHS